MKNGFIYLVRTNLYKNEIMYLRGQYFAFMEFDIP